MKGQDLSKKQPSYIDYMTQIVCYVEEHLYEKINVETLAKAAMGSVRNCYRDFYSATGHTLKEYVRRRRLSKTLELIKNSKMTLTDIAYECGFSSQQSMNREIKSVLGCTPNEYSKSNYVYYFPSYNCINEKQICVETIKLPKTISVIYYQKEEADIENNALTWLKGYLPEYKGRIFGCNADGNQKGWQGYRIILEYSDSIAHAMKASVYQRIEIQEEQELIYAHTFTFRNAVQIQEAWNYLYNVWLPQSMFNTTKCLMFEEYLLNLKTGERDRMILYVPVEKKVSLHKLSIEECKRRYFIAVTRRGVHAQRQATMDLIRLVSMCFPFVFGKDIICYSSSRGNEWTCGFEVTKEYAIPSNEGFSMIIEEGRYAVLQNDIYSEESYHAVLKSWLEDSKETTINEPFSLYFIRNTTIKNTISPFDIYKRPPIESYVRLK